MPRETSDRASGEALSQNKMNDINRDLDKLYAEGSDRGKIIQSGNLTFDLLPFAYRVGQSSGQFLGDTNIAVTDNATNYVMIDSSGAISISTSARDNTKARIGIVIAAGGIITSIEISKPDVVGGTLGATIPYSTVSSKSANTNYQAGPNGGMLVCTASGSNNTGTVVSDSSPTPSTVIAYASSSAIGGMFITVPILPNMYYKASAGFSTVLFYEP